MWFFLNLCLKQTPTWFTNIQHKCDTANSNLWHWSGHVTHMTRDNVHVWHVSCLSSAVSHQVSPDIDWSTRNICQETSCLPIRYYISITQHFKFILIVRWTGDKHWASIQFHFNMVCLLFSQFLLNLGNKKGPWLLCLGS